MSRWGYFSVYLSAFFLNSSNVATYAIAFNSSFTFCGILNSSNLDSFAPSYGSFLLTSKIS
ncbi:hypothetical protein [Candidatus Aquarickettsia rohweri]|uniref:Secreted protein n=1 Tax=Candidatus Aquarickettsia rohweri TaxID=2602574 RepID=A0A3R9ZJI9_9RICK|nr:hypothetical protein [Candidatus Aquarickettsia rohweri]RST63732.1 hypothetical protein EIC27_05260 [Candidatus Aquarickettsia rohweri]